MSLPADTADTADTADELRRELMDSGRLELEVVGPSMEPTLAMGSKVTVHACTRPRIGDVVLYRGKDGLILHRVGFAAPKLPVFVHVGDAPHARAKMARVDRIIGRADLPRRLPTRQQASTTAVRLVRSASGALAKRAVRQLKRRAS